MRWEELVLVTARFFRALKQGKTPDWGVGRVSPVNTNAIFEGYVRNTTKVIRWGSYYRDLVGGR
jgi:hypothetical protein